ncbi:MAG: peptidoglycan-binding domain-containing protein [Candidatus Margulisiibacteriota bacterium]
MISNISANSFSSRLDSNQWVKDHLKEVKAELGDLKSISVKKIIELLKEVKDVNWSNKAEVPPKSAKYIFAMQSALHMLDYGNTTGKIDAVFGVNTSNGLKAFQKDKMGIANGDGQPGIKTISKLIETLRATFIENSDGKNCPTQTTSSQNNKEITQLDKIEIQPDTTNEPNKSGKGNPPQGTEGNLGNNGDTIKPGEYVPSCFIGSL